MDYYRHHHFIKVLEIKLKPNNIIKINNVILLGINDKLEMKSMSIVGLKSFLFSGEVLIIKIYNISKKNKYIFL